MKTLIYFACFAALILLAQADEKTDKSADKSKDTGNIVDEKKKPSITVAGIDDEGKKTEAIARPNITEDIKVKEDIDTDTKLDNVEHVKNDTETLEEVFLPAEGAAEKEHSSSLAIFFVLFVLVLCIFLIHFILQNKCHYNDFTLYYLLV